MTSTIKKGRPKAPMAYTRWDVHLDAALAAEVEMFHWDPVMGKPRYGSRRALIDSLLRRWIAEQRTLREITQTPSMG